MRIFKYLMRCAALTVFWILAFAWVLVAFTSPIWFYQIVVPIVPDAREGVITMLSITWIFVAFLIFAFRIEIGEE